MSRCDYDGVFYRVFCVSLLVIAFTFTVILTNVFVDIDSILSKKEQEPTDKVAEVVHADDAVKEVYDHNVARERNNYSEGSSRTKRSPDPRISRLRKNSSKSKQFLTKKLAALLEALDEEAESTTIKDIGNIYIKNVKQRNNIAINEIRQDTNEKTDELKSENNILHLTLHNIMLQGIKAVDTSDVYQKLLSLVSSLKHGLDGKDTKKLTVIDFYETTTKSRTNLNDEQTMSEELLKYTMKKQHKPDNYVTNDHSDAYDDDEHTVTKKAMSHEKNKDAKYVIKTLIDIKNDQNESSNENFQGIIKLIYNGKPIKIRSEDDETTTTTITVTEATETTDARDTPETTPAIVTIETTHSLKEDVNEISDVLRHNFKNRHMPDTYLKSILLEYLKKFTEVNSNVTENQKPRIKRKLDSNEKQTELPQVKDDDELFVEIETHFDKKGLNGERKRKIVRSLIEKIQNAIASEPEKKEEAESKSKPSILKRVQNPLSHGYYLNTKITPASFREIDPLSKSVPTSEYVPHVTKHNEADWKKESYKPKFLSTSKSINSAELSLLDIDYSQNTKDLRIPQRVQIPLTLDSSDETVNVADLGNLQLLVKDVEGSGFSIAYNQFVDQAPDPESIKLFQGVEHIVNEYHQAYDQPDKTVIHGNEYKMYGMQKNKRDVRCDKNCQTNKLDRKREKDEREMNDIKDYHSNEYEYIFKENFQTYNAQKKVHDLSERKPNNHGNILRGMKSKRKENSTKVAFRNKRSLKLEKLVNLKKKIQVNKFINTNPIPRKWKNINVMKRNKRQIKTINVITKPTNNMFFVTNRHVYNKDGMDEQKYPSELLFSVIEEAKFSNRKRFILDKHLFQPNNQPYSSHKFGTSFKYNKPLHTVNTFQNYMPQEKKKRYKRQFRNIRIIARDMTRKDSDERTITGYNEDMYAGKAIITQLDGPEIIQTNSRERHTDYDSEENEQYTRNNRHPKYEHSTLFDHDKHVFDIEPLSEQLRENPLMLKYPHIFVEDKTSKERLEPIYVQRERPKYESKEADIYNQEALQRAPHVQELINAVAPNRDHYKVSIKLIPHDNDNDTNMGFKEIHTSINKTFNKNGILYSSLVNVSEISKIEVSNDTAVDNLCSQHLKATAPANVNQPKLPTNIMRGSQMFISSDQLAELNEQRNQILSMIKPIVSTTESVPLNLMDIISPTSPNKVVHLNVADVGKLICNAIKSNAETETTTTQNFTPKTTVTIMPTTNPVTTTTKQHSTNTPQPMDPLKLKLLKAISQNEQLTSQILFKINQNTDILKTFLAKITQEIAKLPSIAHQAATERNGVTHTKPRSIYKPYAMNKTEIVPNDYATPPTERTQDIKSDIFSKNHIQVPPQINNLRPNDIGTKEKQIKANANESNRWDPKYFIDDHAKTQLPHPIPEIEMHKNNDTPRNRFAEERSKHLDHNNDNYDNQLMLNNFHRLDALNSNAIVQNNTAHY